MFISNVRQFFVCLLLQFQLAHCNVSFQRNLAESLWHGQNQWNQLQFSLCNVLSSSTTRSEYVRGSYSHRIFQQCWKTCKQLKGSTVNVTTVEEWIQFGNNRWKFEEIWSQPWLEKLSAAGQIDWGGWETQYCLKRKLIFQNSLSFPLFGLLKVRKHCTLRNCSSEVGNVWWSCLDKKMPISSR